MKPDPEAGSIGHGDLAVAGVDARHHPAREAPAGLAERGEQGHRHGVVGGLPFGVPLHGEGKGMIGQLDRFHQSIRRITGYAQRGGDVLESLVVEAVDFDNWLAKYLSHMSAFFDFDFVNKDCPHVAGVGMIQRVGKLIRNVSV